MKTAEEICRSRVEPNDLPDYQVLVLDDAIKCAREFAAQEVAKEVEAYKERLKAEIELYDPKIWSIRKALTIIDTTK